MAKSDSNLLKGRRRQYAEASRKVAYLRRRAKRAEPTAGQKFRLEVLEGKVRDLKRYAG